MVRGGHRETLPSLDDLDRTTTFRFDDTAGLPVRDHAATFQATGPGPRRHLPGHRAGDRQRVVTSTARSGRDAADQPAVLTQVRDLPS
jgi:hypothetical protein